MRKIGVAAAILVCATVVSPARQAEPGGARELFYDAMVKKDAPPPVHRVAAASPGQKSTPGSPPGTAAMHLGLRYNLVLVDETTGRGQAVPPDRMFRPGECFAIDFESNRAGFLYVLARQSSGSWHPLLPSTEEDMATESNVIMPGSKVRVPQTHCFEIQNPPGVETLFVVLSREPRDSFELYENIISPGARRTTPQRTASSVQVADNSVADGTVARMRELFATRDIVIRKISQPQTAAEPAGSVYVVNSSANPASNVAVQIEVHHR